MGEDGETDLLVGEKGLVGRPYVERDFVGHGGLRGDSVTWAAWCRIGRGGVVDVVKEAEGGYLRGSGPGMARLCGKSGGI